MMAKEFSNRLLNIAQSSNQQAIQSTTRREQRVRKRKVHFSTKPDDINHDHSSPLTMEEKKSIWYSVDDTNQMKRQAKLMSKNIRLMLERKATQSMPQHNLEKAKKKNNEEKCPSIIEGSVDETRGLEYFIFARRRFEKEKATRMILEEQRKLKIRKIIAAKNYDANLYELIKNSHERLALVSADCSQWAKDLALATGKLDFEDLHESNSEPPPKKKCLVNSRSFDVKKRRFALKTANLNIEDVHESNNEPPPKKKILMNKRSFPIKKRRFSCQAFKKRRFSCQAVVSCRQ